jgi:hypothetical protein
MRGVGADGPTARKRALTQCSPFRGDTRKRADGSRANLSTSRLKTAGTQICGYSQLEDHLFRGRPVRQPDLKNEWSARRRPDIVIERQPRRSFWWYGQTAATRAYDNSLTEPDLPKQEPAMKPLPRPPSCRQVGSDQLTEGIQGDDGPALGPAHPGLRSFSFPGRRTPASPYLRTRYLLLPMTPCDERHGLTAVSNIQADGVDSSRLLESGHPLGIRFGGSPAPSHDSVHRRRRAGSTNLDLCGGKGRVFREPRASCGDISSWNTLHRGHMLAKNCDLSSFFTVLTIRNAAETDCWNASLLDCLGRQNRQLLLLAACGPINQAIRNQHLHALTQ